MKAKIYHNPRCSKSRSSLQILIEQGVEVEEIKYLDTPPNAVELNQLCELLLKEPIDFIRTGEKTFKALGLSSKDVKTREEWIDIMVKNPILIERPIVVVGDRAVIGRPPEAVLDLIK